MPSISRVAAFCMLTLVGAGASLPVKADNNKGPNPAEYEKIWGGNRDGLDVHDPMFWYHAGMIAGFKESAGEYARMGQKPLFCLPAEFWPTEMRDLIIEELAKDGATWRRVSWATAEKVALHVLRRQYPC
mgnify:CR=1 FL=1